MNRRGFLSNALATWGNVVVWQQLATLTATGTPDRTASSARSKLHVQYIRDKVPTFEVPHYLGHHYEDSVPDTLDVAERARLGVNALTSIADAQADYEIYGAADFFRNPPTMMHD